MAAYASEARFSDTSSPTLNVRSSGDGDGWVDNGEGSSEQRRVSRSSREEEKRRERRGLKEEDIGEKDFAVRKRRRREGGFLLDGVFKGGSGKDKAKGKGRQSAASGSPLSREVKMADAGLRVDSVNTEDDAPEGLHVPKTRTTHDATPPHPAFDPNQIVHMALSLNESRRRNLSAGHLLPPQAQITPGRRDGSLSSPGTGSGHLRQYLNEQRRVSRNISPFGDKSPGRHMSMSAQRRASVLIQGPQGSRTPSEATWRRVEKTRALIELKVEYLRLLESLPPLKPDSTSPGNFVVMANNVPGSPHAQLTRIPSYMNTQYELGRPYNPLQLLRNRRTRARERRNLEHPPEEFSDVEQVQKWVDRVAQAAQSPSYRQPDGVALPKLHDDHPGPVSPAKPTRPNKVWMFTVEELLADAHWLEHADNKAIVEDRHGRRIFPPKEPQKLDLLSPRGSKEYAEKRRRSWVEGLVADTHNTTGDESEAFSERGRKRKILPTFRADSPKHKKHNWLGSKHPGGSSSDSSDSDSDGEKRRAKKTQKMVEGDNETGALKLRMKHLMEREAKETPLLVTPDTPNKWGSVHPAGHEVRSSSEVPDSADGSAKAMVEGLKLPPKQRQMELSVDPSKEYRSSLEEFDSTAPSTPIHARHFPHADGDVSPALSRTNSARKHKKSKLDFLRSDESKARHEREHDHLRPSSRHVSEEVEEGSGIGSAIWGAPGAVKNFLGHRKNESVNSLVSPVKDKERRDFKVTRFIKGVKNEGSKVGEFIFRKDRPAEDSDSDVASDRLTALESETDEEHGGTLRRRRPNLGRSTTVETSGTTTSKPNHSYHLELPSFRSHHHNHSHSRIDEDSASELSDHHITVQARATAQNRSPRFDKLAPPGLDLSHMSSKTTSPSTPQDRMAQLLARPGGVGHAGLPVTSLAHASPSPTTPSPRRSSRPTLEGKRHWSITDSSPAHPSTVLPSDISRIRALFLCSGIKAREITVRASLVRSPPPPFLTRAANSTCTSLIPVPRAQEHVLAARILTDALDARIAALEDAAKAFCADDLTARIAQLRDEVETRLVPRVRDAGDDAMRVSSVVSAQGPLAAKQVADDMEHMLRLRRRRTRWVRRVGWTLLEWVLLGIMWGLWFFVTLARWSGRGVGGLLGVVRWLLWL